MIRQIILQCVLIFLLGMIILPIAMAQEALAPEKNTVETPKSRIFIYETLSRYLPSDKFEMMNPATFKKSLLIPKNPHGIPSQVTMNFVEQNATYGFAILICDAENAALYFEKRPASCVRHTVESPTQTISFASEGRRDYYLIMLNKAIPVPVVRTIEVKASSTLVLPQKVQEKTREVLQSMMDQLEQRFGIAPLDFAVVPCRNKYIPSDKEKRRVTLCSDLILGNTLAPDGTLLSMTLFYELAPILMDDWGLPVLENERERIRFALSMFMTFIKSGASMEYYYDTMESSPYSDDLWQRMQMAGDFTYYDRLTTIAEFISNPNKENDEWMRTIYRHMTDETLQNIKNKNLQHYGARPNEAREILNEREGF